MTSGHSKILDPPNLSWGDDGTPRAKAFGDLYYSADDPAGEVRHVFLDGIGVPAAWKEAAQFVIGETGFGSGLNFLVTWQLWQQTARPGAQLDYISLEGFPLSPDDLRRALDRFPDLAGLAGQLMAQYPPPNPGVHRLIFEDGRLRLTLLYGEAAAALGAYAAPSHNPATVDAWYLDGFAPKLNPHMWRPELLAELAGLSAPGARIASYTAAGKVRRGLEAQGFSIDKRPGFGAKRHAISGRFAGARKKASKAPKSVAIIGGGIAGCALAWLCTQRGLEVILIERHTGLAEEASGNPAALIKPQLMLGDEAGPQFMAAAALYAGRFYERIAEAGQPIWHRPRGAVELASDKAGEERLMRLARAYGWPAEAMQYCDRAALAPILGVTPAFSGLYFPAAGCLDPAVLCPVLAAAATRIEAEVGGLAHNGKGWAITDHKGADIATAKVVVIAAGMNAEALFDPLPSPLRANRGQLGYLPASEQPLPRAAVGYGGYLTPRLAIPGIGQGHILGASFDDWPKDRLDEAAALRDRDFDQIMERLATALPDLAALWKTPPRAGRVAIRAATPDRLPLAGRLDDEGRYLLTGFGSRGFLAAPLAAELVACQILGTPSPLASDIANALDPWRFEQRRRRRSAAV